MSFVVALYLALIFAFVFGISLLLMHYLVPNRVQQRLRFFTTETEQQAKPETAWMASLAKLSTPFAKFSAPKDGGEKSTLRTRFMNAGVRSEHAAVIYFGAKTLLVVALPTLFWLTVIVSGATLSTNAMMSYLLMIAAAGFYFPNLVLDRLVTVRQREIFENLPNALDLLTICVEAGLAIDAGIARVVQEMAVTTPALSEELHLLILELRAGSSKEKALRNLAMRTGVEEVDTLVTMLIQAERFGTSIGDALRVHADHLRVKRRQRAEEAAVKIALKLMFPLIFCIFPALMLVLLGPAMIQIYRVL